MGTMAFGSLYPGGASNQEARNPANASGTAKVPTRSDFDVPVLPGVAGWLGISLPMLLALGVICWFLLEMAN